MEAQRPVLRVIIEAVEDRRFAPQHEAFRLAHELSRRGHEVSVRLVGARRDPPRLKLVGLTR
jgi:hypothetical protein